MSWGPGIGMGEWLIVGLLMLLFWGAIIAVVAWAIWMFARSRTRKTDRVDERPLSSEERALQIAQERYARGEISREEYEDIRQTLRS